MTIPRSCNRIESTVSEIIDRSKRVQFSFAGTLVDAHPGDTVASALYASGTRIFSRSFKYHRPRGILSAGAEELDAGEVAVRDLRGDTGQEAIAGGSLLDVLRERLR